MPHQTLTHFSALRKFWIMSCCFFGFMGLQGQTEAFLSLKACYQMAEENYPLVRQYDLLEKSKDYSLSNASKAYLPQIHAKGTASYQTDVTEIPISLPMLDIPTLSKDHYNFYGEVTQPITDLFTVKHQKQKIDAENEAQKQNVDVELYKIKERINQIYFAILLLDGQLEQLKIKRRDIESGIDKNKTAINSGTALKSSVDVLEAELIELEQHKTKLKAARKGYANMLAQFIGRAIDENTSLEKPGRPSLLEEEINRPELTLYDKKRESYESQKKITKDKTLPKFSLFVRGGYGRPGLDMLKDEFKGYAIGGIRLNWNISSFYTNKKERKLLNLKQKEKQVEKETFLFNTRLEMEQQNDDIDKYEKLIQRDKKLIEKRENITASAKNQLEHGTTTATDYLTHVNDENEARQERIIHEIKLLKSQYEFKTTAGN